MRSNISTFWTILHDETVIHDIRDLIKRNRTETTFTTLFKTTQSRSPNTELIRFHGLILLENLMNNLISAKNSK